MALGARIGDADSNPIPLGGIGLSEIDSIDLSAIPSAPPLGITCLVDVNNPLVGPRGSPRIFAPQKGASETEVQILENGLKHLQKVSKGHDFPGAGAAGGTPFGLSLVWEINLESGALSVATLIGLQEAIKETDLVITGEGRLDEQSSFGKVVGTVTALAEKFDKRVIYCVGSSKEALHEKGVALLDIAPSLDAAMSHPKEWLIKAGAELAKREGL
jgi:glycerate kinase